MKMAEKFLVFLVIVLMSVYIAYFWLNDNKQNSTKITLIFEPNDPIVVNNYTYNIINKYPHDPKAFTQGLFLKDDVLYESTGLYGSSSLRMVNLKTGKVTKILNLSSQYFAEGITIFDDKIYQLTWLENKGFIYNLSNFEMVGQFNYSTEGWGITHDTEQLIMSDGSENLYFLDPDELKVTGSIQVNNNGTPVTRLNELEYINGKIFANVWQTDYIVIIDPQTGNVTGWVNLTGLLSTEDRTGSENVLNGIAYDPSTDHLLVTGKKWPKLFEIELIIAD
jgi:glutamine cyclotransferase